MNDMPCDGTEDLLRIRGVHKMARDVCIQHRVTLLEMLGSSRSKTIAAARGAVAYELRKLGFSWNEVGALIGRHQATAHASADGHAERNELPKL